MMRAAGENSSKPPLHVAFFMADLEDGGAPRRVLTLAGKLLDLGLRVDLLLTDARGPLREQLPPGVRVVEFRSSWRKAWWRTRAAIPRLSAWLRRERPDVLVAAANHAVLPATRAHAWSGATGTALVLRVSNALIAHRNRPTDPLKRWSWRRALPQADRAAVVAMNLGQEILRLTPALGGRVCTVPNPVLEAMPDLSQPSAPPWPPGAPVVLGIGRLVEQKDFATLIQAFAKLRQERVCRLVVLGEGPLRQALESLAVSLGVAEDVSFAGFASDPAPAFRAAAVTALSSRWEGMPAVLVEAMAHGCPVVTTDCGGSRELLLDGALGPVVPVGDADALATGIGSAIDQPRDSELLRARAADFTSDAAATEFLRVLTAAIAYRKGRSGKLRQGGRAATSTAPDR